MKKKKITIHNNNSYKVTAVSPETIKTFRYCFIVMLFSWLAAFAVVELYILDNGRGYHYKLIDYYGIANLAAIIAYPILLFKI